MEDSELTSDLVEGVLAGTGHVVVHADDPEAVAEQTAERLGAELVFSVAELEAAISERLAALARRTAAAEALDVHARANDLRSLDGVKIADIASLRRLAARIDAARHLVTATRDDMRDRVGVATGLAVHPDTIRGAAAEVQNARATAAALETELETAEAEWRASLGSFGPDDDLAALDQFGAPDDQAHDDESGRSTKSMVGAGLVFVGAVFVAVAAQTAGVGPVAFALPAVAAVFVLFTMLRPSGVDDASELASENLAAMSAMTDLAYGGAAEPSAPPAVHDLQMRLDGARDRVRYAENAWRGLVGPGVEVESLDDVLRARDPRSNITDDSLDLTPAVRTAQRHVRRLQAQWKLAWWTLDRPVPSPERAGEVIDGLVSEGIDEIVALTHDGRRAQDDLLARFEELRGWRAIDELRLDAEITPTSVVALDTEGVLTPEALADRASSLGGDVRVVVVAAADGG